MQRRKPFGEKILEIRGNHALPSEKKVPTIFEFPPAKVRQISKSPKRRRNYSAPFFSKNKK
jgi:hypothetical protein